MTIIDKIMDEEISSPVYALVVKQENLQDLKLYLDNMKSMGLYFENVPGTIVDAIFIKVSISEMALQHFSELYDIGNDDNNDSANSKSIFIAPFPTLVSHVPPRQKGQFFSFEIVMIVNKVLESTKFTHQDNDCGMSKLRRRGILLDAYPLHDGPATKDGSNERSLLLRYWSNVKSLHREQPIDLVQRYFGHEVAFYFAWLEYFNIMLILPAVLGAIVFIVGLIRIAFFEVTEVEEICRDDEKYICPTCERKPHCKFNKLSKFCSISQWTYVFDNHFTVAFAALMSFWATCFVAVWRRQENRLKVRWNANCEVDDMETKIRGIYRETAKGTRINPYTGEDEPYVPKLKNIFNYIVSFFVLALMILVMFCSVTFTTVTGIEFRSFVSSYGNTYLKNNKIILSMVLGSLLRVLCIQIIKLVFSPLSIKLTTLENPATQHDYDNSVLYKRYILSFVNNLSPLFYLAFIKGKFYTLPHKNTAYLTQDVCQPQSCIVPICIQLTFLLTLRSFAGNMTNLIIPQIKRIYRKLFRIPKTEIVQLPQWEEEYFLQPSGRYLLTSEYSEMIIKYCFVTFFVGAFPLAPLCALINNILELRTDAYKLVRNHRRPIPLKKNSIGAWNGILYIMSFISTATNAFVIAFTSDFIPDQIFHHASEIKTYYDFMLSKYATKDYPLFTKLDNSVEYCWYRGHYNPPDDPNAYERNQYYWFIVVARFIGIALFEHIIFVSNAALSYFIPKVPESVKKQINLTTLEEKEKIIKNIDLKNKDKTGSIVQVLKI